MKISEILRYGSDKIVGISGHLSKLESRILLSHALNIDNTKLFMMLASEINEDTFNEFDTLLSRRLSNEPIAYIVGYKEFFSRNFFVDNRVLIPRNDSETLIEAIINTHRTGDTLNVLEFGVGSGCLIITLLLELPKSKGLGVEVSRDAFDVAIKNTQMHKLEDRLEIINDCWTKFESKQKFDVIISNPPYIDKNYVNDEIKYEPNIALFADENGYEKYREIANISTEFLSINGFLYVEIGNNMMDEVRCIFKEEGFRLIDFYCDISGIKRCLKFGKG